MKTLDCIKFNPVADEATQWVSPVFVKKSKKGLHFIQLLMTSHMNMDWIDFCNIHS